MHHLEFYRDLSLSDVADEYEEEVQAFPASSVRAFWVSTQILSCTLYGDRSSRGSLHYPEGWAVYFSSKRKMTGKLTMSIIQRSAKAPVIGRTGAGRDYKTVDWVKAAATSIGASSSASLLRYH
jgi:hypothetical protein